MNSANQYTSTTLIECNRVFSEEFRAGNTTQPALFTNKTTPIHLDAGDEISFHSGYISEVGAGGDVIEITGKQENTSYTLESTSFTKFFPTSNTDNPFPLMDHELIFAENVSSTYLLQDNKASVGTTFYTNLNGNCTAFLPRFYDKEYDLTAAYTDYDKNWTDVNSSLSGQNHLANAFQLFCYADYKQVDYGNDGRVMTQQHDSSRMKIYVKKETAYVASDNTSHTLKYYNGNSVLPYSPLQYEYIPYKDKIDFELDIGYDTPSNIANKLTTTMNKIINSETLNSSNTFQTNENTNAYSRVSDSNTYKKFFCANEKTFSQEAYVGYYQDRTTAVWNASAMNYLAAHSHIGVRRPEIFEAGREMFGSTNNGAGFTLHEAINSSNNADTAEIVTQYDWDTVIDGVLLLDRIKTFFDAQKLYPELFVQKNIFAYATAAAVYAPNVANARFLHFNGSNISNKFDTGLIGSDNILYNGSGTQYDQMIQFSKPLFVEFVDSLSEVYSNGLSKDDLCYGFAYNKNGKIAFLTEKLGGIPNLYRGGFPGFSLFDNSDATGNMIVGQPFGYDWHSTGYANSICILYSGYLGIYPKAKISDQRIFVGERADGSTFYFLSEFINYTYLGSNSALLNFDSVSNRFGWQYLHSPERLGGQFIAGANASSYEYLTDASNEVYKINPITNNFSFTPDMKPYAVDPQPIFSVDSFIYNRNFKMFAVIDSHSGIFLDSFGAGLNEQQFNRTLWSILGFSYQQLYPKTPVNIQERINSITLPNMKGITTNANITSAEISNETVNIFSNQMFTGQIPTFMSASSTYVGSYIQPITVNCESAIIRAVNLPSKTTRPYFIVRTSLLGEPTYQGGINSNELYPVICVINKINGYSDFFSQEQNQVNYTLTKPMTISTITTSIHDPDQKLATVDDHSSVIYKVTRNRNQPNLAKLLLEQNTSQK